MSNKDNSFIFQPEERVLCFHGPLIYEAKVISTEYWQDKPGAKDGPHYFVHYKGWKQTWDEWVPENRAMKYNEINLQKAEELRNSHMKEKRPMDRKLDAKGKRKQRFEVREKLDDRPRKPEISLTLADNLKLQLVDDWEYITKQQKLVSLPRIPSASTIFDEFKETKLKEDGSNAELVNEIIEGFRLYFAKCLGTYLLYRFEREQYVETRKEMIEKKAGSDNEDNDAFLSNLYGAEHLLRLCVKLPSIISETDLDDESTELLGLYIQDLLNYISEHADRLFLSVYDNAAPEYIALSKNF